MKKFISSLVLMSMAFGATANTTNHSSVRTDALDTPSFPAVSDMAKTQARQTAPAGEHKTYSRSSLYFYILFNVSVGEAEDYATEVIYGDNDEVYFKAPLSADKLPADTYLKGVREGNVIKASFPQKYATVMGVDCSLNRMEYRITDEANQTGMYFIADNNEITFTIKDDGSIEMEESVNFSDEIELPDFILGMTDNEDNWTGYGDFNQVYRPFEADMTTLPPNAEITKMQVGFDEYAAKVMDMAIVGDKMYLAGFNPYAPEACITGVINGDKVTFDCGQYLGIDGYFNSFAYFWAVKYEMAYDELYGDMRLQMIPIPSMECSWDAATKTLTTDKTLVVNLGNEELAYLELYHELNGKPYNANAVPAKPMAPVFDVVTEYNPDEYYKYGTARFLLPMIDVNGNLLDTSKMYYNFLIDGVPYEFKASEYEELKENMTNVPWGFTDTDMYGGYDFKANNITHIVYFYDPSMKMLDHMGLQQFYKVDESTVLASDVTYYGKPSSVALMSLESAPAEVEYYNLQGIRVDNPQNGVFVKVTKADDGSVKSSKVNMR